MPSPEMDRSEKAFADGIREIRHAGISPEHLELMGKEAANRLLERDVALNESISKLAGQHPDISSEQVKRVCEFANTAVYLARHDQAKVAGAGSSYPQFELADPARIIHNLNDGSTPTVTTSVDLAYSQNAKRPVEKTASVRDLNSPRARAWEELENLFLGDSEKRASADFTVDTVVEDVYALKDSLTSTKDLLQVKGEQLSTMFKEASDEYYTLVRNHLLEGGSFTDILAAAQYPSWQFGSEKTAVAIQPTVVRLVNEKVASADTLKQQASEIVKVAHRVINPEHPFVKTLGSIIDLDLECTKVATALDDVDQHLQKVQSFIRENILARPSA